MILGSVLEVLSIGAIVPFLAVLADPKLVYEYQFVKYFFLINMENDADVRVLLAVIFVALTVISASVRILLLFIQTKYCHRIGSNLSLRVFSTYLYNKYEISSLQSSTELISAVTRKANEVVGSILMPLLIMLSNGIIFLGVLVLLLSINVTYCMVAFTSFGVVYLSLFYFIKPMSSKSGNDQSEGQTKLMRCVQDGVGSIRDVILCGQQSYFLSIFHKFDLSVRKAQLNIHLFSSAPKYAIEAIIIALLTIFACLITLGEGGLVSKLPTIGLYALASQRIFPLINQFYSSSVSLVGGNRSLNDVLDLIDIVKSKEDKHTQNAPQINLGRFQIMEIKDLSFSYNKNKKIVINDLNFKIRKGDWIALIGKTGFGKSTLMDLLMGLLTPSTGVLKVNNVILNAYNQNNFRQFIGHVPQKVFLTEGSVAENIAFGLENKEINYQKIEEVLSMVEMWDFISSLELGMFTPVGEDGKFLSGGQRQRIGIARALYRSPQILFLDESTSALDIHTENILISNLKKIPHLTVVAITHRMHSLVNFNVTIDFVSESNVIFLDKRLSAD